MKVRANHLEGSRKPRRRFAQALPKVRARLAEGSRATQGRFARCKVKDAQCMAGGGFRAELGEGSRSAYGRFAQLSIEGSDSIQHVADGKECEVVSSS